MLKKEISRMLDGDIGSALIQGKLDGMFLARNDRDDGRVGVHASSVIASDSDFCYREHVLSFFYKKNKVNVGLGLLRIFLAGWYIHKKWQDLFVATGVAESVEKTRKSSIWSVYMTPDAVVRMLGKKFVVEIKSENTYAFGKRNTPHAGAVRQANLYMYGLGIPHAIIIVEDKNNQQVKSWVIEYDRDVARPFVLRLSRIKRLVSIFSVTDKLPKRICASKHDKRAAGCPMREACFGRGNKLEGPSS